MGLTRAHLLELGFKPAKKNRGLGTRKFDTLIYKINENDYIYLGYNDFRGNIDFKTLWKSILTEEEGRISYPIQSLGTLTYNGLKKYIEDTENLNKLKKLLEQQLEEYGEDN